MDLWRVREFFAFRDDSEHGRWIFCAAEWARKRREGELQWLRKRLRCIDSDRDHYRPSYEEFSKHHAGSIMNRRVLKAVATPYGRRILGRNYRRYEDERVVFVNGGRPRFGIFAEPTQEEGASEWMVTDLDMIAYDL